MARTETIRALEVERVHKPSDNYAWGYNDAVAFALSLIKAEPEDADTQPDITAWAAGAYGASPELTAAWLAVMEAGIKSGEMPGWRSMDSAPMDGTEILVRWDNDCFFEHAVVWRGGLLDYPWSAHATAFPEGKFDGWMPLPTSDPKQDRSRADDTGGTDA